MKPNLTACLALTVLGLSLSPSRAQLLLNDDFDGYADQTAFQSAWALVSGSASGTLSSLQSVSPNNSVNYGITAQRNERTFTETGTATAGTVIRFSFDFYDANAAAAPFRQYANLQDTAGPSGSGQLISLGLNNNLTAAAEGGNFYMARILGYNSNNYFKLNDDAGLLRSTGWHNLAVEISDTSFKFYVDNQLAKTVVNSYTLRSYEIVRLGSGLSSSTEAFFDNVRVEVLTVPEPTAAALFGLSLSALIAHRRARK